MKTILLSFSLLLTTTTIAAPVVVVFDFPVQAAEGALYPAATLKYMYIDTEHLDVYSSIGSARMCYPPSSVPVDSTERAEFYANRERGCQIEFTSEELMESAFVFIKNTVPAKFKSWAQSRNNP